MTAMLEALLDETGGDEHHPLMGVVSEILTGKRELNLRQVRALSARFGVSAATFL
jgi:antitoxin component HigA of HigAB toxin-antitoxin module